MLVTPYLVATSGESSTLSLPILTLPANCVASLSIVGPRARHGPHQGAQKSTTTGTLLSTTSVCQFWSVNSRTFSFAMIVVPRERSFRHRFIIGVSGKGSGVGSQGSGVRGQGEKSKLACGFAIV